MEATVTLTDGILTAASFAGTDFVLAIAGDGEGGNEGGEGGEDGDGEVDENAFDTMQVTTTNNDGWNDEYISYTAIDAGTYTFKLPKNLGLYSVSAYDNWKDAEVDYVNNSDGQTVTVRLEAGESYSFYIGSSIKKNWTISIYYEA